MTRIVITGLGLSTSVGPTLPETWAAVSGPGPTEQRSRDWGLAPISDISGLLGARRFAQRAVAEALAEARVLESNHLTGIDASRIGCTFSASKPLADGDLWRAPDEITSHIVRHFGFEGESRNVIAACATGVYSIALGASWIEAGLCDVVVAGSVEPDVHPLMAAGFRQMGVVTSEPVMRPFDRDRSGFVFGSGAGALVLESEAHARARGQEPLAILSGWGLGADGHSAFAFNSGGARIADVIKRAITRARLSPESVAHVNAHGTATPLNDRLETQALRHAFGSHAEKLMISATKSSTGHLLGAAGSVEAALTVLAIHHQRVPPTRTLQTAAPDCPLDYTPREGRFAPLAHAISLSFGFGGSIGALVFSEPS